MVNFKCPACGKDRTLAERVRGRKFRCLDCKVKVKHQPDGRFEVIPDGKGPAIPDPELDDLATAAIDTVEVSSSGPLPAPSAPPQQSAIPVPPPSPGPGASSSPPQVALDKMTGKVVGNYLLIGLIGSGATSHVYLAEHQALRRRLAVKILSLSLTSTPDKTAKLLSEAVSLAKVDHSSVVRVYDFGISEGIPFMAMEFVDGQSLDQTIKQSGIIPPDQLSSVASQLLDGLKAIHDAGLLHRDIKPGNVLISKDKAAAKLVDFGLAREMPTADEARTSQFSGTAEYAAPELAVGRPPDIRSDLYALGATLYKAATGRVPFAGGTVAEKLNKQLYEPLVPPRVYNPQVPSTLENLILKLMAKDREQRPSSCLEAKTLAAPPKVSAPATRRVRARSGGVAGGKGSSPSSGAIAAAVVLLSLVGAIGYLAYRSSEKAKAEAKEKITLPPPLIVKELPPKVDPPKEPEKPLAVASILRLRQGTYLAGLISFSGESYSVLANGETVKVSPQDVDRWFKSAVEMAVDAGIATRDCQQLYDRATRTEGGASANAFLRQAVDKAAIAHDGYLLTRQYFSGPENRWLDESLTKAKELLKLVREAELASRIKGTPIKPPSDPDKDLTRKPPSDDGGKKALEKAMSQALEGILSGEASGSSAQRRAVRDKLLLSAGPASRAFHASLLIYLSCSEYDWGTRLDELTLSSPTIQYKSMPGRILRKSSLGVEFELSQGGVVAISQSGSNVRFTPPGGENQPATEFSITENIRTPQAQALLGYFKMAQERLGNLDAKAHLDLMRMLRAAVADLAGRPSAVALFLAAHANEVTAAGLSDREKAEVDAACRSIGFVSSPSLGIRGTTTALELALYYESLANPGAAAPTTLKSTVQGSVHSQLVNGFTLIQKAVASAQYKDFIAAQTALDTASTSARRAAFREHFAALSATVRQAAPCRTCGGKHTLAIPCRECKGTMRRDYACAPCGGHGYVMVLSGAGLVSQSCNSCSGRGIFRNQPCKMCKAVGSLDCKDCKDPWRVAMMSAVAVATRCGMCGGQGILFRDPILDCPDCFGLGVCLAPAGNTSKVVSRPLQERDAAELIKARGRRMAATTVAPFNGNDLSDCDFPVPAKKACWSAGQGKLVCENLDVQYDAMIQFAKVKGGDACSLSLSFSLPAEYFNLKGNMAVEFTAPGGAARWVLMINNYGGMNVQKYDGEAGKWIWVVPSQQVIKQAELANWNRLEVSIDEGKLSALLNGEVVMNTTLDQSIQGGYVGLRARGGVHSFKDLLFKVGAK